MKLLFDQNISRHLVDHVRDVFPGSVHVAMIGLAEATDAEVWEHAGANDYIVVSKDSDFASWRPSTVRPRDRVAPARQRDNSRHRYRDSRPQRDDRALRRQPG
ncbi:MAG: DUF5615 family PIN-like protein [Acidimicrobiia bacterium]|nr:DUF5615 family PIN-like protein [Acidimicrobiia bacterium]